MGKKQMKNNKVKAKKVAEKKASQKKTLDLGLADKSHLIKKAKTHKGRKFLESRAP